MNHFKRKGQKFMKALFLKRYYGLLLSALFIFLLQSTLHAQAGISGPDCIITGLPYQYTIAGQWGPGASARVCITGGHLESGDSCVSGAGAMSSVMVIWGNNSYKKIELISSSGNATKVINATTGLSGGEISESDKARVFDSLQTSYIFHCGEAEGGSCTPSYQYQWQKSADGLNWDNIVGATSKDFQFMGNIMVNTYFRRKVTEIHSNSISYSDQGILAVAFN